MPRFRLCSGFCLALLLLGGFASAHGQSVSTPMDRAAVGTLLQKRRGSVVSEAEWARLRKRGKKALPLLASFLSDPELKSYAESIMETIAPDDVVPYLLKDLDQRDVFVQRQVFLFANQRIQEYACYVRQGKPASEPPGFHGYQSNTKPVTYLQPLHQAAVQMLYSQTDASTVEQMLLTIGLTGSQSDIALLKRFKAPATDASRQHKLQAAHLAALARLGDSDTLVLLERELQKPVPTKPATPFVMPNGDLIAPRAAKVISDEDELRLHKTIFAVGFSMNRRFVPLLVAHTTDPTKQYRGDYPGPSAAMKAQEALQQILTGREMINSTICDWY